MTDIVAKIQDLQDKRQKAQTAVTKLTTQLETHNERRAELATKLKDDFGITFEEAEAKLEELKAEQQELLEKAEKKLSSIGL